MLHTLSFSFSLSQTTKKSKTSYYAFTILPEPIGLTSLFSLYTQLLRKRSNCPWTTFHDFETSFVLRILKNLGEGKTMIKIYLKLKAVLNNKMYTQYSCFQKII